MNHQIRYIVFIVLNLVVLVFFTAAKDKSDKTTTSYFPMESDVEMVYKSSFGETITQYFQDGEYAISSTESEDFKYRQIMIIKEGGIYVKETYQYLSVFLFINSESTITYEEPLLRFPLPLSPGMLWNWEGDEYSDGDTSIVKVTGRVMEIELITTKAGRFETIKLETIIEGSSNTKNRVTEWYAENIGLIKAEIIIEGGGIMGFLRDLLGYGTINFELEEMRKQ